MILDKGSNPPLLKIQTERKWLSQEYLLKAFRDEKTGEYQPRTWAQLTKEIPKATLSRLLNEFIKEKIVEARLNVGKDGARKTVYSVVGPVMAGVSIPHLRDIWLRAPNTEGIKTSFYLGIYSLQRAKGRANYLCFPPDEENRLRERIQETLKNCKQDSSKQVIDDLLAKMKERLRKQGDAHFTKQ